jgi:transposase-like protein
MRASDARRYEALQARRLGRDHGRETLTYHEFPAAHWRRIRTNNDLERLLREIRRRTRVVGVFPNGESPLNLAAARLR